MNDTPRLGSGHLVIATHNAGKLREISALLAPYGVDCISAGSLGLPEPAETGTTFVENALIKARAAADASQIVSLASRQDGPNRRLDGGTQRRRSHVRGVDPRVKPQQGRVEEARGGDEG